MRALVGALNWASRGTRPDIAFEVVDTSMKLRNPTVSDLCRDVKAAIKAKADSSFITFPNLGNPSKWSLEVLTDASRANMCDKISTARGYVVFLVWEGDKCALVNWECNKVHRVVKVTQRCWVCVMDSASCKNISSFPQIRY